MHWLLRYSSISSINITYMWMILNLVLVEDLRLCFPNKHWCSSHYAVTHVRNKNSSIQGRSPNVVKAILQVRIERGDRGSGLPPPWKITSYKGFYRNKLLDPPPPGKSWTPPPPLENVVPPLDPCERHILQSYHKELLLKERIRSLWKQILSFKRSSYHEKRRNWRESVLDSVVSLWCA